MIGSFQLHVPILLPTGTKFKLKKVQYLSLWKEDSGEGASGRSGAAWVSLGGPSTVRLPPPAAGSELSLSWARGS